MTTLNEASEAVFQRFLTQWANRTRFVFENEDFVEPTPRVPWVRVSVRQTGGGGETIGPIGGRKYRRLASAYVQVFTPVNMGRKLGDDHAHFARAIFEGRTFSGLDFTDGFVRELGSDGKYNQHNVEAEFAYEEIK